MNFKEFMKGWEKHATSVDIKSEIWYEYLKNFYGYVRNENIDILKDVNLNHIPFDIRWALSEKFPELTQELLINTRSFDSMRGLNGGWHIVYNQDSTYINKYLIPYVFKSHNTYHLAVLKPLILEYLDYVVS